MSECIETVRSMIMTPCCIDAMDDDDGNDESELHTSWWSL